MHNWIIPVRAYWWWINRKRESGSVAQAQAINQQYVQIRRTANWFRRIPWFLFPGLRSSPNQESQTAGIDIATLNLGARTYSSTTGIPSTDQTLASIMSSSGTERTRTLLRMRSLNSTDGFWHLTVETLHTLLTVYGVDGIHPGGWFFIFALSVLGQYRKVFCIDSRRSWRILNWAIHRAVLAVFLQVFIEPESNNDNKCGTDYRYTCMALVHNNGSIGVTIDIWFLYGMVLSLCITSHTSPD